MPFQGGESGELFFCFTGSVTRSFYLPDQAERVAEWVSVCSSVSRNDNVIHPSWMDTYCPVPKDINIGDDPDTGDLLQPFTLFIV